MTTSSKLTTSAVFITFGVILPVAFHYVGAMGPVFLPMHIPILIAGLFLGARAGFLTGLITPGLSSLLTGMPPLMPTLPIMTVELSIYGLIGGFLYRQKGLPLLLALVGAMITGRLAAAVIVYILAMTVHIKLQPLAYLSGAVLTGLPGIAIQLVLIPLIVNRLKSVN
ncbi:ECF transporter S component [Sporolituus thermophilus]|uniref:Niacin transporter n=1 Tax=Sporolituus thermophilus DSM 23256 TaxID=1123285 RepID=A0A1G7NMJ1_9FIRM|nr:ECF transporter S component [Sporolituus thermophilus]SDF74490.1 Protein of unknown function [Sporolituus thermophilus DSM 23256]